MTIFIKKSDPNANKFVNQGYGEYEYPIKSNLGQQQRAYQSPQPQQQQQQQRQPSLQAGTRIIPIQVEGNTRASPNNESNTIVMQR